MGRKRRKFTDNFKAQVALEALRGDRTIQEIAARHNVLLTQVSTWKKQAVEDLSDVFSGKAGGANEHEAEVKELHARIGSRQIASWLARDGIKVVVTVFAG